MPQISNQYRTHDCGQLRATDIDKTVKLVGWVSKRRDHGGLVFVDLHDRYGMTQVVLNPQIDANAHELAHAVRTEYVLQIEGKVSARPEGTVNDKLATGGIEVYADNATIVNKSNTPPFVLDDEPSDIMKLKYRYLEIRRGPLMDRLKLRHKIYMATRAYLDNLDFIEVETPVLNKSTPEGARDYLVPSRVNQGQFLCSAPIAPTVQTTADGGRNGSAIFKS